MFSAIFHAMKRLLSRRDPRWEKESAAYRKEQPHCEWCGGTEDLETHHIIPFHVDRSKEMLKSNWINLCMKKVLRCHFQQGHKGESWNAWDPKIREKCAIHRASLSR